MSTIFFLTGALRSWQHLYMTQAACAVTSGPTWKCGDMARLPYYHLRPADYVILLFGGVRPLARLIGRAPSSVSRWQRGHGTVPAKIQPKLLSLAKARRLDLTPDDLILGRTMPRHGV